MLKTYQQKVRLDKEILHKKDKEVLYMNIEMFLCTSFVFSVLKRVHFDLIIHFGSISVE